MLPCHLPKFPSYYIWGWIIQQMFVNLCPKKNLQWPYSLCHKGWTTCKAISLGLLLTQLASQFLKHPTVRPDPLHSPQRKTAPPPFLKKQKPEPSKFSVSMPWFAMLKKRHTSSCEWDVSSLRFHLPRSFLFLTFMCFFVRCLENVNMFPPKKMVSFGVIEINLIVEHKKCQTWIKQLQGLRSNKFKSLNC